MEESIFAIDYERQLILAHSPINLGYSVGKWKTWWLMRVKRKVLIKVRANWWAVPRSWVV